MLISSGLHTRFHAAYRGVYFLDVVSSSDKTACAAQQSKSATQIQCVCEDGASSRSERRAIFVAFVRPHRFERPSLVCFEPQSQACCCCPGATCRTPFSCSSFYSFATRSLRPCPVAAGRCVSMECFRASMAMGDSTGT